MQKTIAKKVEPALTTLVTVVPARTVKEPADPRFTGASAAVRFEAVRGKTPRMKEVRAELLQIHRLAFSSLSKEFVSKGMHRNVAFQIGFFTLRRIPTWEDLMNLTWPSSPLCCTFPFSGAGANKIRSWRRNRMALTASGFESFLYH